MFHTTVWTQLAEAGGRSTRASDDFVQRYRAPLIQYIRRTGVQEQDAQDVAQEVFLRLFSQDLLSRADKEKGRFRSYLLGITSNVLRERKRREQAKKRGAGQAKISLDQLAQDPPDPRENPDFDDCWLSHIVLQALEGVRAENERQHELLVLVTDGVSPKEIAERLGRTAGQVRTDLHRARKRLARCISAEVARYCSSEAEYNDELASILGRIGEV